MKMNRVKCSDIQCVFEYNNSSMNVLDKNYKDGKSIKKKNHTDEETVNNDLIKENDYSENFKRPKVKTNHIKCTNFLDTPDPYDTDYETERNENINNSDENVLSDEQANEIKQPSKNSDNNNVKEIIETNQEETTYTDTDNSLTDENKNEMDDDNNNNAEYTVDDEEIKHEQNVNKKTCNISIKVSPMILDLLNYITIKAPEEINESKTSDSNIKINTANKESKKVIEISLLKQTPLSEILKSIFDITYENDIDQKTSQMIEILPAESDLNENDDIQN